MKKNLTFVFIFFVLSVIFSHTLLADELDISKFEGARISINCNGVWSTKTNTKDYWKEQLTNCHFGNPKYFAVANVTGSGKNLIIAYKSKNMYFGYIFFDAKYDISVYENTHMRPVVYFISDRNYLLYSKKDKGIYEKTTELCEGNKWNNKMTCYKIHQIAWNDTTKEFSLKQVFAEDALNKSGKETHRYRCINDKYCNSQKKYNKYIKSRFNTSKMKKIKFIKNTKQNRKKNHLN